jgi:Domain of unknown function (DUF4263)
MRTLEPIKLDVSALVKELDELEIFLKQNHRLRERKHVLPFFQSRKQLCAAISLTHGSVGIPDRVALELSLFGDFACDAASGDSKSNAYTLIEFEDANEFSIFKKLQTGKSVKYWSTRFERGFSQLVDWAWRLTGEGATTAAYRGVFGENHAKILLLLIVGRDADLTPDDLARVEWRASNISLGAFRMSCLTFDGVLATLRRRLLLASR